MENEVNEPEETTPPTEDAPAKETTVVNEEKTLPSGQVVEIRKNFPGYGGLTKQGLAALGTKELVDLYNSTEPAKKIKVFTKKSDGVDSVWSAFPEWDGTNEFVNSNIKEESDTDMAKKNAKAAKTPKAPKEKGASKPRGGAFPEGAKIKILVDGNPKREGSSSHKRFGMYKQNMLVSTALGAGVKTADIHWDVKHNYITIV